MKTLLSLFALMISTQFALANEAGFDGLQNDITPQDEALAEDYMHQGVADRTFYDLCGGTADEDVSGSDRRANRKADEYDVSKDGYVNSDLCTAEHGARTKSGQFFEAMLPAVTKAYAIIGIAPSLIGNNPDAGKLKQKDGSEAKQDICKFIPLVGEGVNSAQQQISNSNTQQNFEAAQPQFRQRAAFEALIDSHETSKTAATMQSVVYGSTAACYGVYAATGTAWAEGNMLILKIGAASLISFFYGKKAVAHKRRAEAIQKLIDKFPKNGDCNPVTETTCFCNEISSYETDPANYKKYCVPDQMAGAKQNGPGAYVCADAKGKVDPSCECEKTNSCIDKTLKMAALDLGFPPTMLKDPLASLKPLSAGFGAGTLGASDSRNRNIAKKLMNQYKPKKPINLSPAQLKLAKQMNKMGIPKALAARMASMPTGSNTSLPAGLADISGGNFGKTAIANLRKPKPKFQKGGSVAKKSSRSSNPFGKFGKRGGGSRGGIQIDGSYAKKATLAAEIHSNTDVSIFRVISNRYQRTGWKQFPDAFEAQ